MNLNKNVVILFVIAVPIAIGLRLMYRLDDPDRALMERSVSAIAAKLPRTVDSMTTQTGVELGDHVLRSTYQINATYATDPETIAAFRKEALKQACAGPDMREILGMGYALDNVYNLPAPRGPGQFEVLIKPGDCV